MTIRNLDPVHFVGRPVWAEVSVSALKSNLQAIRKYVNPVEEDRGVPRQVLSIVKGNGYGHGGPQVAKILEQAGSDWFGVASAGEGMELRRAGVQKPILVLGGFWPGEERHFLEHELTPAIHRCEQVGLFEAVAAELKKSHVAVHLKFDTGMNRMGIRPIDVDCVSRQLGKARHLEVTGVFTHFASSEVLTDTPLGNRTAQQIERLYGVVDGLRRNGIEPGLIHLANSAAIAARPESWADMVRPGAILYGYHPGFDPVERLAEFEAKLALKPALSLRARILNVRDVAAGDGVGYDHSWVAQRPSRIAVICAGYHDGIHRSLANRGKVAIHGHLAPMVGIISMDVTMVDVTEVPDVAVGDIATAYGVDGERVYPANAIARSIGTVTSDLLCGIGPRVPRIYVS